jgi:hypothetical protein
MPESTVSPIRDYEFGLSTPELSPLTLSHVRSVQKLAKETSTAHKILHRHSELRFPNPLVYSICIMQNIDRNSKMPHSYFGFLLILKDIYESWYRILDGFM